MLFWDPREFTSHDARRSRPLFLRASTYFHVVERLAVEMNDLDLSRAGIEHEI